MQSRGLDDHNQRAIHNRDIYRKIIRQMSVTKCQASVQYHGCPRDLPLRRIADTGVARRRRHGRLPWQSLSDMPSVVWWGSRRMAASSDKDAAFSTAEETDATEIDPSTGSRNRSAKYSARPDIHPICQLGTGIGRDFGRVGRQFV